MSSAQAISFASTQMADRASAWRRLWRSRGLALDRILPHCYQLPVPDSCALRARVPSSVSASGLGRRQLTAEDVELVVDAANFVTGYVASLPAQVVAADSKELLPRAVSHLAVPADSNDGGFAGSFDLVLRVRAERSSTWRVYNDSEMAVDVKLLGVASALGVKSPTLMEMFRRGKAVLSAARACDGHRLAGCRVAAYLLRRPPGPTFHGVACPGRWGFVAVDVEVLLAWNETSAAAPQRFLTLGTSLVTFGRWLL